MTSRNLGRLLAAPIMFVGVRWATAYVRTGAPWVRDAFVGLGAVMLSMLGVMVLVAIFASLFPRLAARLFPWMPPPRRQRRVR